MHSDYLAAECSAVFEHGNLVRGLCPLGMFSQTFAATVGAHGQHVYLQNTQLSAQLAQSIGLIHHISTGVDATKKHAHEVARIGASSERLAVTLCGLRLPTDSSILAREAVGNAQCQLLNRRMTKSPPLGEFWHEIV